MTGLFIGISAAMILLFAILMVAGSISFAALNKKKYDVLSNFPFELVESPSKKNPVLTVLIVVFSLLESFLFCTSIMCNTFAPVHDLGIFIIILSICLAAAQITVFLVPAFKLKQHISVDVAFFCVSILLLCLSGIVFMNMRRYAEVPAFVFMGVLLLFALLELVLIINPKISHWAELTSTQEQDGSICTHWPRPFVLAFSEWIVIILDMLGALTFIIGVIYFSLNFQII